MRESILRTLTPILVALIAKTGADAWLGVEDQVVQSVAAGGAAVTYYVSVRVLERVADSRFGWLLGSPGEPEYPPRPRKVQ